MRFLWEKRSTAGAECLQNEAFGRKGASGNKRNPDLKDAVNETMRESGQTAYRTPTMYWPGHAPHPFPTIVDGRHRTGGKGTDSGKGKESPAAVWACHGGSNAMVCSMS